MSPGPQALDQVLGLAAEPSRTRDRRRARLAPQLASRAGAAARAPGSARAHCDRRLCGRRRPARHGERIRSAAQAASSSRAWRLAVSSPPRRRACGRSRRPGRRPRPARPSPSSPRRCRSSRSEVASGASEATCGRWVMQITWRCRRRARAAARRRRGRCCRRRRRRSRRRPASAGRSAAAEAGQREHDPRELAARRRVAQRRDRHAGVGRDPQLDRLGAGRRRSRRDAARARPRGGRRPSPAPASSSATRARARGAASPRACAQLPRQLRPRFARGVQAPPRARSARFLRVLEPRDLRAAALGVLEHRLDAAAVLALSRSIASSRSSTASRRSGSASRPSA